MKRTTERADLVQKDTPEFISGCRQFEGEDLCKLFYQLYWFKSKNCIVIMNYLLMVICLIV